MSIITKRALNKRKKKLRYNKIKKKKNTITIL